MYCKMVKTRGDFDAWNDKKQEIHFGNADTNIFVSEREIRYITMWCNIWYEENGKTEFRRPVLVIKKVWNLFFTVAMTTKGKNSVFYHKILQGEFYQKNRKHKDSSYIILSQVKVVDKKRFTQKIGVVAQNEFLVIKEKLKTFLF